MRSESCMVVSKQLVKIYDIHTVIKHSCCSQRKQHMVLHYKTKRLKRQSSYGKPYIKAIGMLICVACPKSNKIVFVYYQLEI